jgi:hypothetical protein
MTEMALAASCQKRVTVIPERSLSLDGTMSQAKAEASPVSKIAY